MRWLVLLVLAACGGGKAKPDQPPDCYLACLDTECARRSEDFLACKIGCNSRCSASSDPLAGLRHDAGLFVMHSDATIFPFFSSDAAIQDAPDR